MPKLDAFFSRELE